MLGHGKYLKVLYIHCMLVKIIKIYKLFLESFLKLPRKPASLTHCARAFQNLRAKQENEPLYKDVRDFGAYKEPFSDDLRFKECVYDIRFNKFVI